MSAPEAIETLGDSALLLHFGSGIDSAVNRRVHAAAARLAAAGLPGIVELVPAYASLAVHVDARCWDGPQGALQRCREAVAQALDGDADETAQAPQEIEIPVCYGGEYGPDLDAVAAHAGLPAQQVIALHAAAQYQVALLGFAPGFPYLLGLDPRLHQPRRADPRLRVPAGAVAIGGAQTGIYPRELPGGWQLIGRTPVDLFNPAQNPPNRVAAGMRLRFRPVGAEEFNALELTALRAQRDGT
jgi:KipI family sensor histidine kinase inhibitor